MRSFMKNKQTHHLVPLLKVHFSGILPNLFFVFLCFFFGVLLISFTNDFRSTRISVEDLFTSGTGLQIKVWYGLILVQFLGRQMINQSYPNPRFLSESEFMTSLPIPIRLFFKSKALALFILLLLPFSLSLVTTIVCPQLQIYGTSTQIHDLNPLHLVLSMALLGSRGTHSLPHRLDPLPR